MPAPDPMFRQRLRQYHRDFSATLELLERGSPEWFDCERAAFAVARLHVTLYREAIDPIHSGPHPTDKSSREL